MERSQLFTGVQEPAPAFSEARQGGEFARSPLAGYVLDQMPTDLRAVREGRMTYAELAEKQGKLLGQAAPEIAANIDSRNAEATQLDLHFMMGGFIPSGEDMYRNAPPALLSLIQTQSDRFGVSPFMTYDLIIDVNAALYRQTGRMRVFSDRYPDAERDFYLGHSLAEPLVKGAAYMMRNLADSPHRFDVETVLEVAAGNMDEFRRYMGGYGRLSREAFADFSPYFQSYADGTRNASGAFMPSVQLLELALTGTSESYNQFLDASQMYFPDWSKPVMDEWRALAGNGQTIEQAVQRGTLELTPKALDLLVRLIDQFVGFRMTHLGVTRKQIPGAFPQDQKPLTRSQILARGEQPIFEDGVMGSGGFNVQNVLSNAVHRLLALRQRLTGSVGEETPSSH